MSARRILITAGVAIGTVLFAACGSSSTTPAAAGSAGSTSTVTVRAQNVSGVGMVLVDSRGFTLYYLKGETASNITCTGSCASTWPPLTIASGTQPTAGAGVTGQLGTVNRADGTVQVTYDGSPLYMFASDSGPGQATGQGVGNFFAMTPAGAGAPGATSSGY